MTRGHRIKSRQLPDAGLTPFEARLAERLLELAERGRGLASPNPLVGALLVKGRRVIAEGFYRQFGGPHAEIMALKKAGAKARGATLWSSLEPCTIKAKTPPCTDAIIAAGVKKVIYLAEDPNPRVRATAARMLQRAGVACEFRPLASAAALNFGFASWIRRARPFVTLKAAVSLDGRIADASGKSRGLGDAAQQRVAHALRAGHDAVLIGAGTQRADNPALTVRHGARPVRLIRVLLDRRLEISLRARLLSTGAQGPLWIVTDAARAQSRKAAALRSRGVEILPLANNAAFVLRLLRLLARRGVTSLLVEGGGAVHGRFIRARAWDRLLLWLMPVFLGEGGIPLARLGPVKLATAPRFQLDHGHGDGDGLLLIAAPRETTRTPGR